MDTQIDIVGASSEVYRFHLVDSRGPQVRTGGTFIHVREGDDGEPEVVYAGQADNLMDEAMLRWPRAVETYGATRVYARLRVSGSERRQELQDLLDALRPAMNAAVGELAA